MKVYTNIVVVILAAGQSLRMKSQKAFLLFENKKSFLEKIVETYTNAGIEEIFVVLNHSIKDKAKSVLTKYLQSKRLHLVINPYPERERFYSIKQGLKNVNSDFCFLQNIDNPFITNDLLKQMMNAATKDGCVVPTYYKKEGHPILICKNIAKHLLALKGNEHNLREELKYFVKMKLPWNNKNILENINTETKYQKLTFPN